MTTAPVQQRIEQARADGDLERLAQLAAEAFAAEHSTEELLAWISRVVYEEDLAEAFSVIPAFVTHFPTSRHGVRVCLADSYAARGDFDLATEEARTYLAHLHRQGGLTAACADPTTADWVLQALQLVGTGYSLAGARTYSQTIYAHAISLSDDPAWTLNFEQAIQQTERELEELDNREADYFWRSFLGEGDNYPGVRQACTEMNLPLLAERARIIDAMYGDDPGFALPELEFLLLVTELADGRRVLQ